WRQHDRGRMLPSAATPAWDRPESAQEAGLLEAALARPADPAVQQALGEHYQAAGRPFEALWAVQRAWEAAARPPAAAAASAAPNRTTLLLAQAAALEAGGLRARALALLEEAEPNLRADPAPVARRAELLLRLGRPSAALQTLRGQALTPGPSPENS